MGNIDPVTKEDLEITKTQSSDSETQDSRNGDAPPPYPGAPSSNSKKKPGCKRKAKKEAKKEAAKAKAAEAVEPTPEEYAAARAKREAIENNHERNYQTRKAHNKAVAQDARMAAVGGIFGGLCCGFC